MSGMACSTCTISRGVFTNRGYIAYVGAVSLEELMADDPAEAYQREQDFQIGGMT